MLLLLRQKLNRSVLGIFFLLSLITIPIALTIKKSHHDHHKPPSSPQPFSTPFPMSSGNISDELSRTTPFLFPQTHSTVLPDPSLFFSPHLLSSPLPTNSFFQNFVLKNGDQPEYIHPYLIKSSVSGVSLSYPSRFSNPTFTYQAFIPDLTISGSKSADPDAQLSHLVSSFSDLGVTLDFPSSNLRFFLVRGSPFVTFAVNGSVSLSISTIHAVLSLSSDNAEKKHTITLNNEQKWLLYSSSPINLVHDSTSRITSGAFSGVIRVAILPHCNQRCEHVLDQYSACYPVSGDAYFAKPYNLKYKWEKKGWGDLLMLAHPLHLKLLSAEGRKVRILNDFRYQSIDGDLVGVVGESWSLNSDPISVTWHSIRGIREDVFPDIVSALCKDVDALDSKVISTTSSYFYGKLIARAARLALIAEELSYPDVIPKVRKFLKDMIGPWLNGTFGGNGFLYDRKWGGIISKQGENDVGADFGFGVFNDHHYHLGYFLYGIAVLAKIDPAWGRRHRPQAYSIMADFMNLGRRTASHYPRLRCFDFWKLHSWAGGLTEFADGRNQESTSEAVNAYYSAALMGLAYGDTQLLATGATLAAMEIDSAHMWWHVKEGGSMYGDEFSKQNRVVGVLWANKRDSALWFAPPEWKECRLGIQVLPLLPITEVLFSNVEFVKQFVRWAMPALDRVGVGEGWKGFVHALQGIYDREGALQKIRSLTGHDDGNSLTNLLWWVHSRSGSEENCEQGQHCWFAHYSH